MSLYTFKNWFNTRLLVGSMPKMEIMNTILKDVNIIINVSDEHYFHFQERYHKAGKKYYWFPMHETGSDIGINSIFAACFILYNAEIENKKVYLHCSEGVNRSHVVQCAYYYIRTGTKLAEDDMLYTNVKIRRTLPYNTYRLLTNMGIAFDNQKKIFAKKIHMLDFIKTYEIEN